MKRSKFICAVTALTMTLGVCQTVMPVSTGVVSAAGSATVVRLDPSEASPFNDGKFEGWGTSMGWWGNRIGHSDKMAQQAAEDLYSEDGLGLDIVRYNVGGGDNPTHNHINRSDSKLPCFAVPQYEGGTYQAEGEKNADVTNLKKDENGDVVYDWDWNADHDQINVLTRIKEQNPDVHIEGYTNSPPWFMTKSQCSSGGDDTAENLDPSNYDVFADFLVEVTKHMKEIGLPFDSYSPMNEPNTKSNYWRALSNKQEGNLVEPGANQSGIIKALKDAYTAAGIDTLVAGPDETDLGYTISSYNALTDEGKAALDRIDTHTYGGSNRAGVKQLAIDAKKNLWMSEVDGGWNGFGLADRIITDLNGMQASAWVMWDIIDSHRDANFVDPTTGNKTEANNSLNVTGSLWGVGMGNHDTETVEWANKYYAYGQFTKYINPGDTLIASSNKTLAAYNKDTGAIKVVVNNSGASDIPYEIDMSAFTSIGSVVTEIRSNNLTGSAAEHWKPIRGEAELQGKKLITTAKAGTITTYIIERESSQDNIIKSFSADENGLSYEYALPLSLGGYDAYFAAYNADNALVYVSKNKTSDSVQGDFTSCTHKLLIWDKQEPVSEPITYDPESGGVDDDFTMDYAIISGGGNEIGVGASAALTLKTNIEGDVTWSVSDTALADIVSDGKTAVVTAKAAGSVTVYAEVGGYKVEKSFLIPSYKLSGTPSWGSASSAPADSADYRKAADGDLSTYFDGVANGWVMYDYGEPYKISEVKLAARSGDGMAARTVGAKVQGSNDAVTWTDLYTIATAIPADQYTTIAASELADNKAYRYYRYTNPTEMTNIAEFQLSGETSTDTPADDPVVTDIAAFTDDFENSASNIFNGTAGALADGNVIYECGLERFGNVFVPVNSTAVTELEEAIELKPNQLFRLQFNMFSGWEDGGKDNTFAIKDADGNEIVSFTINVGSSSMTSFNVGGINVLDGTPNAQCKSNTSGRTSANGWGHASQPYRNNMGYNKTVEILIDGGGSVTASFNGGTGDISASGVLGKPISIKSIELTGACNTAGDRVVSYDNLDGDVITYNTDFAEPTPMPSPSPTPEPTDPPELPEDGTLISLNFDNEDLTSGSTYGMAAAVGTAKFVTVDDKKVLQLDNTNATAIKLTDANGNGLLAGQEEITVSFSVKQTSGSAASWWFYSAPNDNAQASPENYIGVFTKPNSTTLSVERYKNGRSDTTDDGEFALNTWHDVVISFAKEKTTLYVDGKQKDSDASAFVISDMLGANPVAYIGRANWGSGEFAAGYIDDFKIVKGAVQTVLDKIDLGDLSAVKSNLTLPTNDGITWTSSNPNVISNTGVVTRPVDTTTVTLTAHATEGGEEITRVFDVTVIGLAASAETFTAYAEGKTVKYTSSYGENEPYKLRVAFSGADSEAQIIEQKDNEGSGSFEVSENGTYKVSYSLTDDSGAVAKQVVKTVIVKDEITPAAYLFAHFVGNESNADHEQIYFSVSQDGTNWTTINGGKPVLRSDVGEKGVRDPYILRGEDGKFFVIATDLSIYNRRSDSNRWSTCQTSGSKSIVVWESDDLVTWSEARLVKVAVDNAGCTWAPEAIYDPEKGQYMVFWASKTATDNYSTQRMYRSYTSDFKTFTEPEIYIDGGTVSNIDTTIVEDKGVYYRFTKNESKSSVTMMKANFLDGPWKDVDTYMLNGTAGNTVTGYEGPTIYKDNGSDKWTLLLDYYSKSQGYKPFVTDDITKGDFKSASDFKFDATYRHGTVMPITQEEYDALIAKYPNS